MTGEYRHTLDAKGRIFIPAKLREELGGTFYVTISPEKCLTAYSMEGWNTLSDRVNALPYSKQLKMRPLFSNAAKCETDGQGRILLPQNLRTHAELEKDVTIVGCNKNAQFWDSDKWDAINEAETSPENIMAVMEELDF